MFFCGRYAHCSENKHTKKQKKNESSSGALYATYRAIYIPYERVEKMDDEVVIIWFSPLCADADAAPAPAPIGYTRVVAHVSNLIFPYSASSCPRCSCYKLQVQAGGSCITKKKWRVRNLSSSFFPFLLAVAFQKMMAKVYIFFLFLFWPAISSSFAIPIVDFPVERISKVINTARHI
jgi:hypothetical protein